MRTSRRRSSGTKLSCDDTIVSSAEIRLIFTGVKPSEEDLSALETLRCTVVNDAKQASYMIACCAKDDTGLKRTPKLLLGLNTCEVSSPSTEHRPTELLSAQHVLDLQWIRDSARAGRHLDPLPYTALDTAAESRHGLTLFTASTVQSVLSACAGGVSRCASRSSELTAVASHCRQAF
jgi:hypothetical protein